MSWVLNGDNLWKQGLMQLRHSRKYLKYQSEVLQQEKNSLLLTDGKFQANCKFKIFIVHKMVGWNKSIYAYLEISLS